MKIIFTDVYASITGRSFEVYPKDWKTRQSRYVGKTEIIDSEGKTCFLINTQNIKEIKE